MAARKSSQPRLAPLCLAGTTPPVGRTRESGAGGRLESLVRAAAEAREQAVAPYSRFKVGAALLTEEGAVIRGANVESASYGLTCCAERVALFKALTEGHSRFVAVAVVARQAGGAMPCGACRQLLAEYAPGATVWVADAAALERLRSYTVQELLPGAFLRVPRTKRHPARSAANES